MRARASKMLDLMWQTWQLKVKNNVNFSFCCIRLYIFILNCSLARFNDTYTHNMKHFNNTCVRRAPPSTFSLSCSSSNCAARQCGNDGSSVDGRNDKWNWTCLWTRDKFNEWQRVRVCVWIIRGKKWHFK
jgi:hypothetical protein